MANIPRGRTRGWALAEGAIHQSENPPFRLDSINHHHPSPDGSGSASQPGDLCCCYTWQYKWDHSPEDTVSLCNVQGMLPLGGGGGRTWVEGRGRAGFYSWVNCLLLPTESTMVAVQAQLLASRMFSYDVIANSVAIGL